MPPSGSKLNKLDKLDGGISGALFVDASLCGSPLDLVISEAEIMPDAFWLIFERQSAIETLLAR